MQAAFVLISKPHTQKVSVYKFVLTSTSQGKSLLDIDSDKSLNVGSVNTCFIILLFTIMGVGGENNLGGLPHKKSIV